MLALSLSNHVSYMLSQQASPMTFLIPQFTPSFTFHCLLLFTSCCCSPLSTGPPSPVLCYLLTLLSWQSLTILPFGYLYHCRRRMVRVNGCSRLVFPPKPTSHAVLLLMSSFSSEQVCCWCLWRADLPCLPPWNLCRTSSFIAVLTVAIFGEDLIVWKVTCDVGQFSSIRMEICLRCSMLICSMSPLRNIASRPMHMKDTCGKQCQFWTSFWRQEEHFVLPATLRCREEQRCSCTCVF